ncbi:MAG: hypothetical protein Q7T32_12645 [Moraxellaceae bacterium]|nr:hypothetical protein [Moraxellaceae bacterium]
MAKRRIDPERIKADLSNELMELARLLGEQRSGVVVDPGALWGLANSVRINAGAARWEYQISNLQFKVDVPQNTRPVNCGTHLLVTVDLFAAGHLDHEVEDPLTALVLEIQVSTLSRSHICTWHFDRHIEGGDEPEEAHPLYHFQFGGHSMNEISGLLGKTLLLPTPRLAFPPMNAILALDFVLSNFAGSFWKSLRDNANYERLLRESQIKYWQPYLQKLAGWWGVGRGPDDGSWHQLWPHLVEPRR